MDLPHDLFQACLSPTDSSTPVRFQAAITKAAGSLHVEACRPIDVEEYEELGHCKRELLRLPAPVTVSTWGGPDEDRVVTGLEQGVWRVTWKGETLHVVVAEWQEGWNKANRNWVLARDQETARAFILDVARVTNDPRDGILVFHGSCWQRSHELWVETQKASFDELILARTLKQRIREDFERFLASRATYEAHGLPWRRGALFLGPPGNGKTHCVRALVKELAIPSLYVQSIKTRYETDEANLKRVFERARQLRPCVLVLEDLDALINAENRSFFLNQLDGFEKNVGMIVLATTNHPDKIDPAILDRPSRFDRKYHFDLPELEERAAYLRLWQRKLAGKVDWTDATTEKIAASTEGFSFAYIKELVVTSLMRAILGEKPWSELMTRERDALAEQMKTSRDAAPAPAITDVEDDDD
ncbi:MAG TPA: ATP-binding protein [Polyangiaceae bacterium]|jgi:AAA+ superfamily predicted ATPase